MKNSKFKINREIPFFLFPFYFLIVNCSAQQMPYYTQFKSSSVFLNPGAVGTKRVGDARLNYRKQWVGFEDAPVTQAISLNARIVDGMMGVGAAYFSDKTGPTSRTDFSLSYAFHAKFEDAELSVGGSGHMLSYLVDGNLLRMHIPMDHAIDLTASQKKRVYDVSAGFLFFNDRFHVGFSVLNIVEPTINFFPKSDSLYKTNFKMVPHYYGSAGYNWSNKQDWIWENSLQLLYADANPLLIDYKLLVRYQEKVFGGFSLRLNDALAVHAGVTFMEDFQISYSYDFLTTSLRPFQSGSHEIMLVWSSNMGYDKKRTDRFMRQKYRYMT